MLTKYRQEHLSKKICDEVEELEAFAKDEVLTKEITTAYLNAKHESIFSLEGLFF